MSVPRTNIPAGESYSEQFARFQRDKQAMGIDPLVLQYFTPPRGAEPGTPSDIDKNLDTFMVQYYGKPTRDSEDLAADQIIRDNNYRRRFHCQYTPSGKIIMVRWSPDRPEQHEKSWSPYYAVEFNLLTGAATRLFVLKVLSRYQQEVRMKKFLTPLERQLGAVGKIFFSKDYDYDMFTIPKVAEVPGDKDQERDNIDLEQHHLAQVALLPTLVDTGKVRIFRENGIEEQCSGHIMDLLKGIEDFRHNYGLVAMARTVMVNSVPIHETAPV